MPCYEHECTLCGHEWEDFYSINAEPPTICPKCGKEGAKRLISLTAPGVVELTGRDLINKVKSDAKKLEKDASKNENMFSNMVGESKYEKMQQSIDKRKRGD